MSKVKWNSIQAVVDCQNNDGNNVVNEKPNIRGIIIWKQHSPEEQSHDNFKGQTCFVEEDGPLPIIPRGIEILIFLLLCSLISLTHVLVNNRCEKEGISNCCKEHSPLCEVEKVNMLIFDEVKQ